MEHNVSYLMALVDRMSAPAEKIAAKFKNINTTISQVQGGLDRVGKAQGLNKLKGSADRIPRSISEIQEKLKLLNAELNNTHSSKSFINLRKEIKATEQQLSGLTSKLSGSLGGGMGSLLTKGLATLGAYFGAQQIFSFAKGSLEAYDEEAKARAQLKAGLVSTRFASGKNVEGLEDLAIRQENKTLFRHDQTMGAEAVLLTFSKIRGKIYDEAIPAIQDLTTRFGGDLATNARMVGKALNEPGQALLNLRRMGIQFSDSQTKNIKNLVKTGHLYEAQMIILAKLNEKFGGSAEAAAKAGMGPIQQLENKWHTLRETIGERMAPAMNKYAEGLGRILEHFRDMIKLPVSENIQSQVDRIKELHVEMTNTNTSHERLLEIYNELKDIDPSIVAGIDAQSTNYKQLSENIDAVVKSLDNKIIGEKINEKYKDKLSFYNDAKNDLRNTEFLVSQELLKIVPGIATLNIPIDRKIGMAIEKVKLQAEQDNFSGKHGAPLTNKEGQIIGYDLTPSQQSFKNLASYQNTLPGLNSEVLKGKGFYDQMNKEKEDMLATMGVNPNGSTKPVGGAKPEGNGDAPDPLNEIGGIASGGSKATNITINLKDLVGEVKVYANSVTEGGRKVNEIVTEELLRVLNSANRVGTQ